MFILVCGKLLISILTKSPGHPRRLLWLRGVSFRAGYVFLPCVSCAWDVVRGGSSLVMAQKAQGTGVHFVLCGMLRLVLFLHNWYGFTIFYTDHVHISCHFSSELSPFMAHAVVPKIIHPRIQRHVPPNSYRRLLRAFLSDGMTISERGPCDKPSVPKNPLGCRFQSHCV